MAVVKETSSSSNAIKVKIVTGTPDLYVYVTDNEYEAKNSDSIWYFKEKSNATPLKFVSSGETLKVRYVKSKYLAKWYNKTHELQGRIK
jgi:hypothetical protein